MTIKKQPQIRFGGVGGDWEIKKLETFAKKIIDKNQDVLHTETLTNSSEFGIISQRDFFDKAISNVANINGYYVVQPNDFVYNPRISNFAPVGPVNRNKLGRTGIVSPLYFVFRTENTDVEFLETFFKTEKWHKFMFLNGDTGARADRLAIKDSVFMQMPILMPSETEQIAIGQFFRQLDEMLTLAEQKHAQTVQLKKAMLGKLFPISGSLQPQIRLKGFSGDWVERKLGDLGECVSGIGFPENEQGGKSGIPFYKVSDMNLPENNIFLKTANNFVTDEQIQQNNWKVITSVPCIFFAKVGAALLLNRKRLVTTPFLLDNNTMAFVIGLELHDYFAKILFDNIDLPKISQVGALPSINAKDVENIIVRLPETLAEQTAIGKLFQTLDHTIALQAKEITQIKQLKSALLGKMFV